METKKVKIQKAYSFDWITIKKMGKSALYAGLTASAAYGLQQVPNLDIGNWNYVIGAGLTFILNGIIEFCKGKEKTTLSYGKKKG